MQLKKQYSNRHLTLNTYPLLHVGKDAKAFKPKVWNSNPIQVNICFLSEYLICFYVCRLSRIMNTSFVIGFSSKAVYSMAASSPER